MVRYTVEIDDGDPAARELLDRLARHATVTPAEPAGQRVLITGGARSGKSELAERALAGLAHVDYVATSEVRADDPEWRDRVRRHHARRPASWRTIETLDLPAVLGADDPAPVLVDCLGVWLTRQFDAAGAWEAGPDAERAVEAAVDALVDAVATTDRRVLLVTNEVGSGIVPATASGRLFRDGLGRLNARVAAACDEVWVCTAGIGQRIKGR